MLAALLGGPLDGSTVNFEGAAPPQIRIGLTPRLGGINDSSAVYGLRGCIYRFEGWERDKDAEAKLFEQVS